jgi:transcriptional regulator with XRE-family HTH domain
VLLTTLHGMASVPDLTESLVDRTKKLLRARGRLTLREIAEATEISEHWLRSFACNRADNPGIQRLEKLHNYLTEFHAAQRFKERQDEARAG